MNKHKPFDLRAYVVTMRANAAQAQRSARNAMDRQYEQGNHDAWATMLKRLDVEGNDRGSA